MLSAALAFHPLRCVVTFTQKVRVLPPLSCLAPAEGQQHQPDLLAYSHPNSGRQAHNVLSHGDCVHQPDANISCHIACQALAHCHLPASNSIRCSAADLKSVCPALYLQRVSKTSLISLADLPKCSPTERQIFGLNKRIQTSARVPKEFPGFIVEGFTIKVVGDGYTVNEKG